MEFEIGDHVTWTSGIGHPMCGVVVELPPYPGGVPLVRESVLGTLLRPRNPRLGLGDQEKAS
jgi:hypothetical protein